MKNLQPLLSEIVQLTTTIETEYPELYKFLDENPMTIPAMSHINLDEKIFQDYLQGLRTLLKTYLITHNA